EPVPVLQLVVVLHERDDPHSDDWVLGFSGCRRCSGCGRCRVLREGGANGQGEYEKDSSESRHTTVTCMTAKFPIDIARVKCVLTTSRPAGRAGACAR